MDSTKLSVDFNYFNKNFHAEGHRYAWPKNIAPSLGIAFMNWFSVELNPKNEPLIILIAENKEGKLAPYVDGHPIKETYAKRIIKVMKENG